MYLGYFPAGARKEYKRKAKVDELQDRLDCFRKGVAPLLYQSFDRVHYYPARYVNFDRMLAPYIAKTRSGYPGLTKRTIKSGARKGDVVADIVPVADPSYMPTRLSVLGKRLLGSVDW